jgi:hypothetical protein
LNHVVFWKMAHWLAQKYPIKPLMRKWYRAPETGKAKTWIVYGINERGSRIRKALRGLVSSPKAQFRWRNSLSNSYIESGRTANGPGLHSEARGQRFESPHLQIALPWASTIIVGAYPTALWRVSKKGGLFQKKMIKFSPRMSDKLRALKLREIEGIKWSAIFAKAASERGV